ncbi:MAG: histidine phosphatase family protein [Bacilli bacterium]
MKIYVVRHGQTNSNFLRVYNDEKDELTELGISQANELKDKIKNINFDIIFCSPLIRTKQTVNIISTNNENIVFDERLKERECGDCSLKPLSIVDRKEYWNYYSLDNFGDCENINHFIKRVHNFLNELKSKEYKKVLIVTHKGVSRAINTYFEGMGNGMMFERGLKNCELKEYDLV